MRHALDIIYDKALLGIPGLGTARDLAEEYKDSGSSPEEQAEALIRRQVAQCATAGFLTGFGGIFLMPLTLPANVTSVLYMQIHMILAIAHLGGHDLHSDEVKTVVYSCLLGNMARRTVRNAGIRMGARIIERTALRGMARAVPIAGGLVGGFVDGVACKVAGQVAIQMFIKKPAV